MRKTIFDGRNFWGKKNKKRCLTEKETNKRR